MSACSFLVPIWKGDELHYTLIEKQLEAMYAALITIGPLIGKQEVKVWIKYPIAGWVQFWSESLRTRVTQSSPR
jgi:hypothetical protein